MKTTSVASRPAVYVSTYNKYASGSIMGAWLYIDDYSDFEDFMAACRELHADERCPEFMFQDFMNFPREFYSESGISEERFEAIKAFAALDEDEREAFEAYLSVVGSIDWENIMADFEEDYCGWWATREDFATETFAEDWAAVMPEWLENYIDWAAVARDMFLCDYTFVNGHVFRA